MMYSLSAVAALGAAAPAPPTFASNRVRAHELSATLIGRQQRIGHLTNWWWLLHFPWHALIDEVELWLHAPHILT
jgi:hypothetical protein